jgi:hypothetical protein
LRAAAAARCRRRSGGTWGIRREDSERQLEVSDEKE